MDIIAQFFACFSQKLAPARKNSTDWSAWSARFCNSDFSWSALKKCLKIDVCNSVSTSNIFCCNRGCSVPLQENKDNFNSTHFNTCAKYQLGNAFLKVVSHDNPQEITLALIWRTSSSKHNTEDGFQRRRQPQDTQRGD